MREFETGATRNDDDSKYDYEGFFSPLVMVRRAEYMHKHRLQSDGKMRDSDNWQKGMPLSAYMKSAWRHFMDWWRMHRDDGRTLEDDELEEAICALMFNCEGYLHELLKRRKNPAQEGLTHGHGPGNVNYVTTPRIAPWYPEDHRMGS